MTANNTESFDVRWFNTQMMLRERFGKLPDMEGILFLIGMNELGVQPPDKFTKEQKQDLMHVAVCTLLSQVGYYEFAGRDEGGWPHFHEVRRTQDIGNTDQQEIVLKECIIMYFDKLDKEAEQARN